MPDWIPDSALDAAVGTLRASSNKAVEESEQRQKRNVIDPFQSLLLASTYKIRELDQFANYQDLNSALRGMSNAIGLFHQQVLSSVEGWINYDAGYDLLCEQRLILAEIKNKHNTMNASNRDKVVQDLQTATRQRRGNWTAYLVIIVPKKPKRYKTHLRGDVYEIDGASFYELVTGSTNAIHELFDAVCDRIAPSEEVANHCREILRPSVAT